MEVKWDIIDEIQKMQLIRYTHASRTEDVGRPKTMGTSRKTEERTAIKHNRISCYKDGITEAIKEKRIRDEDCLETNNKIQYYQTDTFYIR